MGVPDLWGEMTPAAEQRIPLVRFVCDFVEEHHRPVRLAIDAFQWIFECRAQYGMEHFNSQKALQGFHSRIRELISLHVTFVFVFDGPMKPFFKRNFVNQSESDDLSKYDYEESYLKKSMSQNWRSQNWKSQFGEEEDIIKEELKRWNISYINAPAEAEAECARLQQCEVVDYVLTNDVDVFLYGARKVLRNLSRYYEDKPASSSSENEQLDFYVTPIRMEKVERETGLTRWRMLLLCALRGADYNGGVKRIGVTRAKAIALAGSPYFVRHKRKVKSSGTVESVQDYYDPPDFSNRLKCIYIPDEAQYFMGTIVPRGRRVLEYNHLQEEISKELSTRAFDFFGRNEDFTDPLEGFPPDYVLCLYFYPLLCSSVFQFLPGQTNYAETTLDTNFQSALLMHSACVEVAENIRVRRCCGTSLVGFSECKSYGEPYSYTQVLFQENSTPSHWLEKPDFVSSLNNLSRKKFPSVNGDFCHWMVRVMSECYVLRFMMLGSDRVCIDKKKSQIFPRKGLLAKQAVAGTIPSSQLNLCMVRYTPSHLFGPYLDFHQDEKSTFTWVPETLVKAFTQEKYLKAFNAKVSTNKRKPKKAPPQKNNLLSMGFLKADALEVPLTPSRRGKEKIESPELAIFDTSPQKSVPTPQVQLSPVKRKANTSLRTERKKLFVDDEEAEEEESSSFMVLESPKKVKHTASLRRERFVDLSTPIESSTPLDESSSLMIVDEKKPVKKDILDRLLEVESSDDDL